MMPPKKKKKRNKPPSDEFGVREILDHRELHDGTVSFLAILMERERKREKIGKYCRKLICLWVKTNHSEWHRCLIPVSLGGSMMHQPTNHVAILQSDYCAKLKDISLYWYG